MANFLLLLRNGSNVAGALYNPPTPNEVNCSDCASLVTAFGNSIGAGLGYVQIEPPGYSGFALNRIQPIGSGGFILISAFSYHALAVRGTGVYDACLRVGRPDPTEGGTRNSDELPTGMPLTVANPSSCGAPTFAGAGNGTLAVTTVDANTMDDTFTAECTASGPGGSTFSVSSTRSGLATATVAAAPGSTTSFSVLRNGLATVQLDLTQGDQQFAVGDSITFTTTYDYSEYRGSLAAPDCVRGLHGRSAVSITPHPISGVR